jgi:RHS repeat-associated protein
MLASPSKSSPCVGIRTCSDYSPFGVELDGRTVSNYGYRFGYQGSEKDNEFKGDGNSYTTEFRQLDPKLGRWLSVDPVIQPWQSSYCSMDDSPISKNDVLGNKANDWIKKQNSESWEYDSGIHCAEHARARYGDYTQYKSNGEIYQGKLGDKLVGDVTLGQGGVQTWDGGTLKNQDINPFVIISKQVSDATSVSSRSLNYTSYLIKRSLGDELNTYLENLIGLPYSMSRDITISTFKSFGNFIYGDMSESLHAAPDVILTLFGGTLVKSFKYSKSLVGSTKMTNSVPKYLYHYTSREAALSISQNGLKVGKDGILYLTNSKSLSPLQAQIELALPVNRSLPNALLSINTTGISPISIRRVQGNLPGFGGGGGTEFLFNQAIPPSSIKIIK